MNKMELAGRFGALAKILSETRSMMEDYSQYLDSDVDRKAVRSMLTDLTWAVENCTVISLHQQGKNLEDTMGQDSHGA